jgi:hypothetical protein
MKSSSGFLRSSQERSANSDARTLVVVNTICILVGNSNHHLAKCSFICKKYKETDPACQAGKIQRQVLKPRTHTLKEMKHYAIIKI